MNISFVFEKNNFFHSVGYLLEISVEAGRSIKRLFLKFKILTGLTAGIADVLYQQ